MKFKSMLKYILNFVISYAAAIAVLWLLYDNKGIEIILIDGLIITCLFELIEFIGAFIKKSTSKKDNNVGEVSVKNNTKEEAIVVWITGICLILLLVFKLVL